MSIFTDNPDFFPTPRAIVRRMIGKLTNRDAKYFLDPSAGKGDIADVVLNPCTWEEFEAEHPEYERLSGDRPRHWSSDHNDRRVVVDVIESYPPLVQVLKGKGLDVVGFDWTTYQGVSYYDAIIMNPPFSEGAKHLLKAFSFLHHGEIVCLLNEETLKNPYTEERKELQKIIAEFGDVESLGDCFSTAERKTDVRVAMAYLKKVAVDDAPNLWATKTTSEKSYDAEFDHDPAMLAIRDNLGNMEHFFNMANEHWMRGIEHIRKAKYFMDANKVQDYGSATRGDEDFKKILEMAFSNVHTCRAEFLRRHRRLAWTSVFRQMEFERWLDSKQQDKFLRDVERDSTIPFTAENIRGTLENVFSARKKLFEESVANVFDALCSHAVQNGSGPACPESLKNSWGRGEGWKTNDNFRVNLKLIFPYGVEYDQHFGFHMPYGGNARTIYSDLDRILCVLDGRPFDKCHTVGQALEQACRSVRTETTSGGWKFESEYFLGRFFKKGTVHLVWKREDMWEAFNKTAAAGKKWLGENTQQHRPKKRKAEPDWYCSKHGHKFVDGECTRCGDPEVDEVAQVECDWCRAIYEHTGEKRCPLHETMGEGLAASEQKAIAPAEDDLAGTAETLDVEATARMVVLDMPVAAGLDQGHLFS